MSKKKRQAASVQRKSTSKSQRHAPQTTLEDRSVEQQVESINQLAPYSNAIPLRQHAVQRLQRGAGNQHVRHLLHGKQVQRRRPTQTFDFSDEPEEVNVATYNLQNAGRSPYDVIQDHVAGVNAALDNMRTGELNAIHQFMTHMSFESATDAEPDVLGAVFKHVGTQLWNTAIGKLPSVAGVPASEIFGVITAMTDELERAAQAQQSFELANFITTLRNSTATVYQEQITALETSSRRDLEQQFTDREGLYEPGQQIVTGGKAQFLRELDERKNALLAAVPRPIQYEQALIVEWVTNRQAGGEGLTDRGFLGGWEGNGKIQIKYDTEVASGGHRYTFEEANLFTATKSGNAADMLNRIMSERGLKVYEIGIPVQIMLRTENTTPGGRSYYAYWIRSESDYDEPNRGWPPADRAWNDMPWGPIDNVRRIGGGG